jgi:hypothetical protein
VTFLVYARDLRRGRAHAGVVGATLKANRNRTQGL